MARDRLLGLPGCASDQGERHHAHPAKEKESSRRPAEHILQTSLEGNTLSSQSRSSPRPSAPPPTASEAPPCGLFTDTLLVPKAWLQGRLLRDALPGLILAPVNLAAGQVQARPLSSASTSAGRGPGPPALHAPRGSAHCPGSEPLGRSRQRCRCLWGSRRCQLPFPGLATAGPLPPLPAAAGPARAPAAAPRWAGGPAAASSKLSCPAVRPSGHPPQRPALRSALPKPPRAWPSPVLQGLGRDSATVSSSLPGGGVQAASTPVCSHPSAQQVRRLQM